MIDADLAIMPVRLDPRGMPVALPGIADGVHHERIDVRNDKFTFRQGMSNTLLLLLEQASRPGMWHISHDLDAGIADSSQAAGRLGRGVLQVGVGAEGKLHFPGHWSLVIG